MKTQYSAPLAVTATLLCCTAHAQEAAPKSQPIDPSLISLKESVALAQAAITACAAKGEHATAVVMDAAGYERVLMSDDNAPSIGLTSSLHKAYTVLDLKMSTRDAQARLTSDKAFADQSGKNDRYFFHPGGLPLYRQGKLVAVFAVGGGHDKDEDCAKAALVTATGLTTTP